MAYFEWHSAVDNGRVVVPGKCRRYFQSGLELALDEDKRFIAARPYPESELDLMDSQSEFRRLDARGRLTIPKAFLDAANITDVAVIVGSNDYFEIWNQSSWEKEKSQAEAEAKSI